MEQEKKEFQNDQDLKQDTDHVKNNQVDELAEEVIPEV